MSEAIFGLIGVVVGALVTGGLDLFFRIREEKAQATIGLHVLEAEFLRVAAVLQVSLDDDFWTAGSDTIVRGWEQYRAGIVGRLRRDDWHFIALGVAAGEMAPKHFAVQVAEGALTVPLSETDRDALNRLLDSVQRAQTVIGKALGEWPAETRNVPPAIPRAAFSPRPEPRLEAERQNDQYDRQDDQH